jgi:hypothetical protein
MKIFLFEGNTMSKIGQLVQELQENDDSFDGQGWIQSKEEYEETTRIIQAAYTAANGCVRPGGGALVQAASRGSRGVRAVGGGVQLSKD